MWRRTGVLAVSALGAMVACGPDVGTSEPPPPGEPEPFRTSSQLSIFGLNQTFGEGLGGGSSLAILKDGSGKSILDTLNDFKWSEVYITAGGYNTTSASQIDTMRIHSGAFAKEPFDYNPYIYLTLGDRIDAEGGPTDIFEAELKDLYSSPAPARVVIFNTDNDAMRDLDFAAVIYWDIDFSGWGGFGPFELFGTTTLANRDILARMTVGTGVASFDGIMQGMYRPSGGAPEVVTGNASLTMDFATQRLEGDIVDVSTGTKSLQDILLMQSDPPSYLGSLPHEPYLGDAYTADYDPASGSASMSGKYDAVLHNTLSSGGASSPSDFLTGNVALSGAGGDLVGGIIARK